MLIYPHINNIEKLDTFIDALRNSTTPSKVTVRYISSLGFSSSQDRNYLHVLKFLHYIDENGVPTEHFAFLRDAVAFKNSLGMQIKHAYKDLFAVDSEIHSGSVEKVTRYLARLLPSSATLLAKQARTFVALCARAAFDSVAHNNHNIQVSRQDSASTASRSRVVFNINLPETENPQVYDAIFKSLKTLFE